MTPKDDRTSIGNVLLDMGVITQDQLEHAVGVQEQSTVDELLGMILVHHNFCSRADVEAALSAQATLREKPNSKYRFALVGMDEAIKRRRNNPARLRAVAKAAEFRASTGSGHPAITPEMLAKSNGT